MRDNSFIRGLDAIAQMAGNEVQTLSQGINSILGNVFPTEPVAPVGATRGQGVQTASTDEEDAFTTALNSSLGLNQGQPIFQPAKVQYANSGAVRRQPVQPDLEANIGMAVGAVYGPGYQAKIYSGGQPNRADPKTGGKRVGSVRHDGGNAADIHIYDPEGNRVQGAALAPLAQFWRASNIGGVGLEMRGGGIHLDNWVKPPEGGGMNWAYGELTQEQAAALEAGNRGELPTLVQDWSADLISRSDDPNRVASLTNVHSTLSEAFVSTKGTTDGTSDPLVANQTRAGGRQLETALGGMLDDIFGKDDYDDQMKRDGQASVMEVLSVGLGQMSAGARVDVSGVLRAQEARSQQIVQNRMNRYRAQAGAEMVLQQGGSMEMARALATGAISYSDILSERQIANAEAEIARRNAKDATVAEAMRGALTDMGYSEEMIAAGMADPGSFFKLTDLQRLNEETERARLEQEQTQTFRRAWMEENMKSDDPIARQAAIIMGNSALKMDVNEAMDAAVARAKASQDLASGERDAAQAQQEDAQRETDLTNSQVYISTTERALAEGIEPAPLDMEIYRQLQLAGVNISVPEAEKRAIAVLAAKKEAGEPDFVRRIDMLVGVPNPSTGKPFTRDEAKAEILLRENAESADRQAFNDGLQRAQAAGPEALAAFNAKYPNGLMDYVLEKSGRLGGLAGEQAPAPTIAPLPLPPVGSTNPGSLMDNVGQLGGVQGAIKDITKSVIGQFSDDPDPAYTKALTTFNSWRNDAIQSIRSSGRMLSQELELIINDVAPEAGLLTGPDVLKNRVEAVDAKLRQKLNQEQRTLETMRSSGFSTDTKMTDQLLLITDIESVLESLHAPREDLGGGARAGQPTTVIIPGVGEAQAMPLPSDEAEADKAWNEAQPGTWFIRPNGDLIKKE